MATEIAQAYVQIIPSAQGISGKIAEAIGGEAESAGIKSGSKLTSGLLKGLAGGAAALGTAVAGIGAGIVSQSAQVAQYGDNIDKMSQKMGLSAQAYQEWDAIMQHSGTSIDSMRAGMKTLANAVENGNGAFERIGITMDEIGGMSNEDLFAATIAGLQNVENETERTYLAGQLLGRGATELGALLNTSAEETEAMRQRVHELGGVMSNDSVKAAARFQDSLQDMQTAFAGIKRGVASEFLPAISDIMDGFAGLVIGEDGAADKLAQGFTGFLSSVGNVGDQIFSTLGELIPKIGAQLAPLLPEFITKGTELLTGLAVGLIQGLPTFISTVLPPLLTGIVTIIPQLITALIEALPAIADAGIQAIDFFIQGLTQGDMIGGAMSTIAGFADGLIQAIPSLVERASELINALVTGIQTYAPMIANGAVEIINGLVNYLMTNAPQIISSGITLIQNLANGLIQAIPAVLTAIGTIAMGIIKTLIANGPQILQSGITLIGRLAAGIIAAIPRIISTMGQLARQAINALKQIDWLSAGRDIINGIINGIKNAAGLLLDAVKGLAQQAFSSFTSFFKIGSPSKLMENAAEWLPIGAAEGVQSTASEFVNAVRKMGQDAANSFNPDLVYSANTSYAPAQSDNSAILDALQQLINKDSNTTVVLEGDAAGVFRLVRNQNNLFYKSTGYNPLARG